MVGGQAIDLAAVRPAPGQPAEPLDALARRSDARAQDRRADSRRGRVRARSWPAPTTASSPPIDRYAAEIGLAFQIVDDLLDVEAESNALGKTAGKDAAAGKPTYPALFGLERVARPWPTRVSRAPRRTLRDAGLPDSPLGGIARWIVHRRS